MTDQLPTPTHDARLRAYTLAAIDYGIARGAAEGSDDPAGWRRDIAGWARKAARAAKALAAAAPTAPLADAWLGEAAYWTTRHQTGA